LGIQQDVNKRNGVHNTIHIYGNTGHGTKQSKGLKGAMCKKDE